MILHKFCVIELWKRKHSFTGCDTTSKVGTKDKASKVASNKRHQYQLAKFAEQFLWNEILKYEDDFFIEYIASKNRLSMRI